MSSVARDRIVAGAADMLSRSGYARTSVRELAKHAGTPLGSTYHYFPGGKGQLAREAVEFAGGMVTAALNDALTAGPMDGLRALLSWWRRVLTSSGFEAACPVLSVSLTESRVGDAEGAVMAARDVFRAWEHALTDSLTQHGMERPRASSLALLVVCAVEGSVGLCRAEGSTRPLDAVEASLIELISQSLTEKEDHA